MSDVPEALTGSVLVRRAHVVPVGGSPGTVSSGPVSSGVDGTDAPVDVRVVDGAVTQVEVGLEPGRGERVVDADGRWLVPGLWDHHVHMLQWALALVRLDLAGTRSAEEVTRRVADHLQGLPESDVRPVTGFGYRSATWPRPPTVAELDAVSGGRPVALVSGDGHNGWLNSAALDLLGVPPRTGPLDEREWFPVFARLAGLPGAAEEARNAYRRAVDDAAARGVVGVVDLEFDEGAREWAERVQAGLDTLRVRTSVYPEGLDDVIAEGLRTGDALPGGRGLLTMGPLKIISDGSLNTRTAFCCEPYADAATLTHPRGKQNYPPEVLTELLARATANGLEVAVHVIGDAAVRTALESFERTGARGSMEHLQMVDPDDVPRIARLGVRASVQPAHLLDDRDATMQCWPDRADRCFLLRRMLDAGVELALGSDAPVAPLDPWLAMAAAVHRSGDDREPWNPAESLTAAEALAASTGGRGAVAPGSPGDLVLLDADPLQPFEDPADVGAHLRGMHVAATFVAGRVSHMDPVLG